MDLKVYICIHTHTYIYIYIYGYKYIWKKIPQFPTYQIYGLLSLSKFSFLLDYTIKTAEQIIWFHNELRVLTFLIAAVSTPANNLAYFLLLLIRSRSTIRFYSLVSIKLSINFCCSGSSIWFRRVVVFFSQWYRFNSKFLMRKKRKLN